MTVQLTTPKSDKPSHLRLYDQTGRAVLAPAPASTAPAPDYVQRKPQGDTRIMHDTDPVKYKATRFDKDFPPPDESLGGAAVRHAVDAVVKSKEVNLPGGIHLKCKTVLGIPTPICHDPPSPPSAKDGDERLNMAPVPLAPSPHAPKPPSVEACIAMYRAGKPLVHGCPVDTPNRSVDAEMRERARQASRNKP